MVESTRRTVLAAAAGAVLATAGCAAEPTPHAEPATGSSTTAPTPGPLAYVNDLPMDRPTLASAADGTPVLLVRTGAEEVHGLDARCTHMGCVVKLMGAELACPCHNSRFDPRTGARIRGVAPTGLRLFPVRVRAGAVLPR